MSCRLSLSRYASYETTSLDGESNVRLGSSPGTLVGTLMRVWYVGNVWACWTCGVRDSGIVGNCVWNFVRASNVKGSVLSVLPVVPSESLLSELLVASSVGNPYSYGLLRSRRERG